jgi:hypothetical protein
MVQCVQQNNCVSEALAILIVCICNLLAHVLYYAVDRYSVIGGELSEHGKSDQTEV